MSIRILTSLFLILVLALLIIYAAAVRSTRKAHSRPALARLSSYDDLVALFGEWRRFLEPVPRDGVPEFSPAAMRDRYLGLLDMKARLAGIDSSGWPVGRRIDWLLLKAEMNGLDFQHRVTRPWSRDPGFYAVFDQFQPTNGGIVSAERLAEAEDKPAVLRDQLRAVPRALDAARANLTEPAADLALLALRFKERESALLGSLARDLAADYPGLVPYARDARAAVDEYRAWLEAERPGWNERAGIGSEEYTWFVRNVYNLPYDWKELLAIARGELDRAVTFLKIEEQKGAARPPLRIREIADYACFYNEAQVHPLDILKAGEVRRPADPMDPRPIRSFRSSAGRAAFAQARVGGSLSPRSFVGLGPDGSLPGRDPRPLRMGPYPPFHIEDIRLEATSEGMEEMLMHLGLLNRRPRSRELTYSLLAYRAARAIADLRMHAREMSVREAVDFVVRSTPNGFISADSLLLWCDLDLYLRQPGYGVSYLIGAIQVRQLMADRARQLGPAFSVKGFMDDFLASGIIPVSFIRWEMTGLDDQVKMLSAGG